MSLRNVCEKLFNSHILVLELQKLPNNLLLYYCWEHRQVATDKALSCTFSFSIPKTISCSASFPSSISTLTCYCSITYFHMSSKQKSRIFVQSSITKNTTQKPRPQQSLLTNFTWSSEPIMGIETGFSKKQKYFLHHLTMLLGQSATCVWRKKWKELGGAERPYILPFSCCTYMMWTKEDSGVVLSLIDAILERA